jgi:hypothetical protein
LIGVYANDDASKSLSVQLKKDALYIMPSNSKKGVPLYKIGDNHYTFQDAQDYYKLVFTYTNGQVTQLIYTQSIGRILSLNKQ